MHESEAIDDGALLEYFPMKVFAGCFARQFCSKEQSPACVGCCASGSLDIDSNEYWDSKTN